MSYLKVNIDDDSKDFVANLLQKLGYEVTEEQQQEIKGKKTSPVSPTLLLGKWKNVDIDPANFRKDLWARKK